MGDAELKLSAFRPFTTAVQSPCTMPPASAKRSAVVYSDRDHCVAIHGNAVISYSLQPPNPTFLVAWTAAVERLIKTATAPISVVTVIDSQARPPDDGSKRAIRDTVTKHRRCIATFAYVVEGHGFGAAALRSVVTLISLAARYPFPQKVFANITDASAWMAEQMPTASAAVTTAGLISVLEMMRYEVRLLARAG
jgi:hypothetical protein